MKKSLSNNKLMTTVLAAALVFLLLFTGCADTTNNDSEQAANSDVVDSVSDEVTAEEAKEAERASAEEAALTAVSGTFSDYITKTETGNSLFIAEHEVYIEGDDLYLELTANFPIHVSKEAWDAAIANQVAPIPDFDTMCIGFRETIQEHTNSFLESLVKEKRLSNDWSGEYQVVMIVKNSDGEILKEYR